MRFVYYLKETSLEVVKNQKSGMILWLIRILCTAVEKTTQPYTKPVEKYP